MKRGLLSLTVLAALATSIAPLSADEENKIIVGSGFFVNPDGYVVTANHVISNCTGHISIHGATMALDATLVASDPNKDLALLKSVAGVTVGDIISFRPLWQQVKAGDGVIVAGYPGQSGIKQDSLQSWQTDKIIIFEAKIINTEKQGRFTATMSALGKTIPDSASQTEKWLEISHVSAGGNSGGPVLDASGNVIGVIRATLSEDSILSPTKISDIAVGEASVRSFLDANNVRYEETNSGTSMTDDHMAEITDSIVNIRCQGSTN